MLFRIFIILFGGFYTLLAIADTVEVPNQTDMGNKNLPTNPVVVSPGTSQSRK